MRKEECKIVQDLLPNYIENLTNKETNEFIEKHLNSCKECEKIYNNMKEKLIENTSFNKQKEKRKVKFLKKYKSKLRILEIVLLIILLIFVINTGRKLYIINDLNNKASEYEISENYHKTIYLLNKGEYVKTEGFCLGDKQKIVITNINENGERKRITIYGQKGSGKVDKYIETEDEKIAKLNETGEISIGVQSAFWGLDNKMTLLIYASLASINKTTFNGEECYYVSSPENLTQYKMMYVNKNSGLVISTLSFETEFANSGKGRTPSAEYKFEFGKVTEKDFEKPDISEYKVSEE